MKISIQYYSGAGNTEFFAGKIAQSFKKNDHIVNISRITEQKIKNITNDFDILGIGFPIYFREAPKLIYDLLDKYKGEKKPIFFFNTKGLYSGNATKDIIELSISKNFIPIGAFEFYMPGTDFLILFTKKNSLMEKILKSIHSRNIKNKIINLRKKIETPVPIKPPSKKWYTLIDECIVKKLETFFDDEHRKYIKDFYSKPDKCNKCMKCVKECPKNNIVYTNNQIEFGTNCDVCFRCIHHCPTESIQLRNISENHVRYSKIELD